MPENSFKIFKSLNLVAGFTSKKDGDFSSKVLKRLTVKELIDKIGLPKKSFKNFYFMEQVHSTAIKQLVIRRLRDNNFIRGADGLITNRKGVLLLIKTADCLPVLIFDPKRKVIVAIHSGWRGTVGKITLKAILKMVSCFGCRSENLKVAVGPCAKKCCFKHDKEAFVQHLPEWKGFYDKKGGFYYIDLVGKLKSDLIETGVKEKNIEIVPICTICDKRFFSYSRAKGKGEEKEKRFITYIEVL